MGTFGPEVRGAKLLQKAVRLPKQQTLFGGTYTRTNFVRFRSTMRRNSLSLTIAKPKKESA